jgi:short-subunit dehydrogenase involved in D-alanine esterification of teichoic acids
MIKSAKGEDLNGFGYFSIREVLVSQVNACPAFVTIVSTITSAEATKEIMEVLQKHYPEAEFVVDVK